MGYMTVVVSLGKEPGSIQILQVNHNTNKYRHLTFTFV